MFELMNENTGTLYRIVGKHFEDFDAEYSDEYSEETQDYVNFKPCVLTAFDVKRLCKENKVDYSCLVFEI